MGTTVVLELDALVADVSQPAIEVDAATVAVVQPQCRRHSAAVVAPAVELGEIIRQGPKGEKGDSGLNYLSDEFVLQPADIAAKSVQLSGEPLHPARVEMIVFGGIEQRANVDFVVSGRVLSWAGLGLELLVEPGTAFQVRYIAG